MTTRRWVTKNKNGRAVIEYAVLIVIILAALFWMKGPIVRAFYGHWKTAGDSFAFGRQYDPKRTVECAHYSLPDNTWVWADERCFDAGRPACADAADTAACEAAVIQGCSGNCGEANDGAY